MKKQTELTDKAKEARRAYQRKWRHDNKDKVKEHQKRYWNKVAEEQFYFDKQGNLCRKEPEQEPQEDPQN